MRSDSSLAEARAFALAVTRSPVTAKVPDIYCHSEPEDGKSKLVWWTDYIPANAEGAEIQAKSDSSDGRSANCAVYATSQCGEAQDAALRDTIEAARK